MKQRTTRKVVLIGTGMVGMSYAYALLNQQGVCDELVLIDIDKTRAQGEAMDLNHGIAFSGSNMNIYAGDYSDCSDADLITICAGVAQKPGESRPDLLSRNAAVFRSIIEPIMESGFNGIFLIATNPVDVMTYVTQKLSGLPASRVIGSGTCLDTSRLRYLLGNHFSIDPKNIHAYVMGEHGETEFVPWSQARVSTVPALSFCESGCGCDDDCYCIEEMEKIALDVKNAAGEIIKAKKATYYGIGMSMVRITRAILSNESSILTVSVKPDGEYGQEGVYLGLPAVVNASGATQIVELELTEEEKAKLSFSASQIKEMCDATRLD